MEPPSPVNTPDGEQPLTPHRGRSQLLALTTTMTPQHLDKYKANLQRSHASNMAALSLGRLIIEEVSKIRSDASKTDQLFALTTTMHLDKYEASLQRSHASNMDALSTFRLITEVISKIRSVVSKTERDVRQGIAGYTILPTETYGSE
jgi:hypothetical protein